MTTWVILPTSNDSERRLSRDVTAAGTSLDSIVTPPPAATPDRFEPIGNNGCQVAQPGFPPVVQSRPGGI
jgi:hypothetical protein